MKVRTDFVTNSSSSSFICLVCGEAFSGYDACLTDFDLCTCQNDHTFCQAHLVKSIPEDDFGDIDYYSIPIECCPICQFKELEKEDTLKYLMKKLNITKQDILSELSSKFNNYKEFLASIK